MIMEIYFMAEAPAIRTKWEILRDRMAALREAADKIERELAGMESIRFDKPCEACNQYLATEADFARHFIVPNPRLLNIGWCPNTVSANALD